MLLNYHIGRFVLVSLCVGDLMRLGLSSTRVAGFSLQLSYFHFCLIIKNTDIHLKVLLNEKMHGFLDDPLCC